MTDVEHDPTTCFSCAGRRGTAPIDIPSVLPAKPMVDLLDTAVPMFWVYAAAVGVATAYGASLLIRVDAAVVVGLVVFALALAVLQHFEGHAVYYEAVRVVASSVRPGVWMVSGNRRAVTQVIRVEPDVAGLRVVLVGADGTHRYSLRGLVEVARISGGDDTIERGGR